MRRGDPNAWRAWSENASPELLAAFQERIGPVMHDCRTRYPAHITPHSPLYEALKEEIRLALTEAACDIQEDYNAFD